MKPRTMFVILIVLLAVMIIYRVMVPRDPMVAKTLPKEHHGIWVTTNIDYSDRYVEIDKDSITFGTGGVTGKRYLVTGYNREREEGGVVIHTVYFKDVDGSRFSRPYIFEPGDGGSLMFKNQPEVVWVRQRAVTGR